MTTESRQFICRNTPFAPLRVARFAAQSDGLGIDAIGKLLGNPLPRLTRPTSPNWFCKNLLPGRKGMVEHE